MPEYEVVFTRVAREGLAALDRGDRNQVFKQIDKLKHAPELGAPLGSRLGIALAGYRKLYACRKRIRVIYGIEGMKLVVTVIAVGPREDAKVYRIAEAEAMRRRLRPIPSPDVGLPTALQRPSERSPGAARGSASPP